MEQKEIERCEFCGSEEDLMTARWIPAWLRETARAARTNRGVTERIQVCAGCFDADPDANEDLVDGGMEVVE
jgi:hypothetical protein